MARNEAAMRRQPIPNVLQREFGALSDADKHFMRSSGMGPESDNDEPQLAARPRRRAQQYQPPPTSSTAATVCGVLGALVALGVTAYITKRYLWPMMSSNGSAPQSPA